ncbi:hypothetical protein L484_006298 [Morus notabilis]|uniref:Uncharacterized protein n=1 Tax=Morus notabilis TaxID=981085 RepID=W9QTG6_9ROSA|nr:hypothetical protein L484_006298 [Morus notabilis]
MKTNIRVFRVRQSNNNGGLPMPVEAANQITTGCGSVLREKLKTHNSYTRLDGALALSPSLMGFNCPKYLGSPTIGGFDPCCRRSRPLPVTAVGACRSGTAATNHGGCLTAWKVWVGIIVWLSSAAQNCGLNSGNKGPTGPMTQSEGRRS